MGYPEHIAIIMDGNRRYAQRMGRHKWVGHEKGGEKAKEVIKWCKEFDIRELTLYTFSLENFKRPKEEVDKLMSLFKKEYKKLRSDIKKHEVRINFVGDLTMFPEEMQQIMDECMQNSASYKKHTINFAMAYGGRQEITQAARKLCIDISKGNVKQQDIDEDTLSNYLWLRTEPDMVIRTGGERRLSNFLLWQSSYSEWFFSDQLWPEFSKEEFKNSIEQYSQRKRRFGK